MNKPLAIGLILLFVFLIGFSAFWLAIRPEAPAVPEPERVGARRFPLNIFGLFPGGEEATPGGEITPPAGGEVTRRALTLLSSEPIAGFGVTGTTGVRYIERATGHVYDVSPQAETKTRVSNTTIPKIFEAVFSLGASRAILRYLDGDDAVRAVSAAFSASSTQATPLPASLLSAAFSPTGDRIAYLVPVGDGATLVTALPDNSGQRAVVTLPFQEFILAWPMADTFSLVTRPSGAVEGSYFTFNTRTSALRKIVGGVLGLMVRHAPDGTSFVASVFNATSRQPQLSASRGGGTLTDLEVHGLANKCAFSQLDQSMLYCALDTTPPRALWPDAWLQGTAQAKDLVWKIDTRTGGQELLPVGRIFDIRAIDISSDDRFLYFIEKENGTLWSYKIAY